MSPTELMLFDEVVEEKDVMALKSLEEEHTQLQTRLVQRRQALNLQLSLIDDVISSEGQALRLLKQTQTLQKDIHIAFLSELLRVQMNIEDYLEMKGHISNYQTRIGQLRANLIDKEAEIAYQTFEKRKKGGLRRECFRIFSLENQEKQILFRTLVQINKIKNQIEAADKNNKRNQSQEVFSELTFGRIDWPLSSKRINNVAHTKSKYFDNMHKTYENVCSMIIEQIEEEQKLTEQIYLEKIKFKKAKQQHKKLIRKYKNGEKQRQINCGQQVLKQNILSQIKSEITNQTNKTNSQQDSIQSCSRSSSTKQKLKQKLNQNQTYNSESQIKMRALSNKINYQNYQEKNKMNKVLLL